MTNNTQNFSGPPAQPKEQGVPNQRSIQVEVRKKRALAAARAPREMFKGFRPLANSPMEPLAWQSPRFLPKSGAILVITPPGACRFAFSAYLVAYLLGAATTPFGMARYPGRVLVSSPSALFDRSLRVFLNRYTRAGRRVHTRHASRRFNWASPLNSETAVNQLKDQAVAGLVIDAGPMPPGIRESTVDAARAKLEEVAMAADCLILIVVESTSQNPDPFERVPKSLRSMRGTLLVCPLRARVFTPPPTPLPRFLLVRLADSASHTLNVEFSLATAEDAVEASEMFWQTISYDDPREVFRAAELAEFTRSQQDAVNFALEVLRMRGPTDMATLKSLGFASTKRIAPSTMRDALTVAREFKHVEQGQRANRSLWALPGQLPWHWPRGLG